MPDTKISENNLILSDQLKPFAADLNMLISEYERITIEISKSLPKIEKQIDNDVLEARELLGFIFTSDKKNIDFGIKHELSQFREQLKNALASIKETEKLDNIIFSDLKKAIDISASTIGKMDDIFDISENLKVFAINSIVFSQKAGDSGKGYQVIAGEFIKLSEGIASGTNKITTLGQEMNFQIEKLLILISEHEKFTQAHIEATSADSKKLLNVAEKSVENIASIMNDLFDRLESIKTPTYKIMTGLQKQDIIQQQMMHLMEAINDILLTIDEKSANLYPESAEENTSSPDTDQLHRELLSLLDFLVVTVEKQMTRISKEFLEMIGGLELLFSGMNSSLTDINEDKDNFSELIQQESITDKTSIIHMIFQAPKSTIKSITENMQMSMQQKGEIISQFTAIEENIRVEKLYAQGFIPSIKVINNLLLLARIEQARYNLDISAQGEDTVNTFSQTTFSDLSEIVENIDLSHQMVCQNLEESTSTLASQKNKHEEMEENLKESLKILSSTELLFKDNFESVITITNNLSSEIKQYIGLFDTLRELNTQITSKITICSELHKSLEVQLEKYGGSVALEDSIFKDLILEKIVKKCTVDEERKTLDIEFGNLELEESTGSSITLF